MKPAITLDDANKLLAAAEAEATRNKWEVVIAILNDGGRIVAVHRMDGARRARLHPHGGNVATVRRFLPQRNGQMGHGHPDGRHHQRVTIAGHGARFTASTALRPPKANELESAASILSGRASFGT
jgi:hypothetical protein